MTAIEQKAIEAIEDSPFSPLGKYQLLLLQLGVRRACMIRVTSSIWRLGDHPKDMNSELVMDACDVLGKLPSVFEQQKPMVEPALPPPTGKHRQRFHNVTVFLVARDSEVLEQLKTALRFNTYARIGQLYGHPVSSVAAVERGGIISLDRLSPEDVMTDPVRFLDFPLSGASWPTELGKVQEWIDLVQHYSTAIYEQLRMANYCRLSEDQITHLFGKGHVRHERRS